MIACKMSRVHGHEPYKWCTMGLAEWKVSETEKIIIQRGFLTDGSSGGPDNGFSWLFHDFLYCTHKIQGRQITRQEADKILFEIMKFERANKVYRQIVKAIFKLNPFWLCSKAWNESGRRGAEYIHSLKPNSSIDNILANLSHIQS